MSKFRRNRFSDDVVVVRKKAKPKFTPTKKTRVKASLPRKEKPSKSDQNVKAKVKSPTLMDKEKPVKQHKSIRDNRKKRRRIDPKVRAAITRQIDALLPEPPFEIGISKEIFERLVDSSDVSRTLLRRVIGNYMHFVVTRKGYLKKAVNASHRYGLDGGKTEMTEEHRKSAEDRLERVETKIRRKKERSSGKKSKSDNRESVEV